MMLTYHISYVYIPLGGSKYAAYNMWPVFTFVAVWHDVSFKLLTWAWLICLFILPELILTRLTRPYQVSDDAGCMLYCTDNVLGLALLSSFMCIGCCRKFIHDDHCQFSWFCCGCRWYTRNAASYSYTKW
jgi:D-alanyl-lipoteichoic acid acyltransferase DltB (MBOAT superfamily)